MTEITTPHLRLRQLTAADAPEIARLAGDWDIARMTALIPHPYSLAHAQAFIAAVDDANTFAIERDGALVGCCGARPVSDSTYEIGYWVGKPYWGQGIATEAAGALIAHLRAREPGCVIAISHMAENEASARVIRKLGFRRTGEKQTFCVARAAPVPSLTYIYPHDASFD
ncbi:MAG: GNAT family N-acetyltransferase [Hyphomicrobiaceae bacterium]